MIRDPEWFENESEELLDKWFNEDTEMDYPEYLLKHASERTRNYYIRERKRRERMREKLIV